MVKPVKVVCNYLGVHVETANELFVAAVTSRLRLKLCVYSHQVEHI